MILCEECSQLSPITNCHLCEELAFLHKFRLGDQEEEFLLSVAEKQDEENYQEEEE